MKIYRMSELELFMSCGRKYKHKYVDYFVPKKFGGVPLEVGTAIHGGAAVMYTHDDGPERKKLALATALKGYEECWKGTDKELEAEDLEKIAGGQQVIEAVMKAFPWGKEDFKRVIQVEEEMVVDMGEGRGLKVRLDLVVEGEHGMWLHDTKTTGLPLAMVSKAHRVRKQYIGYQLAAETKGLTIVGTNMDFVSKPRVYHKKDGTWTVGEPQFLREPVKHTVEEVETFKRWFHTITAQIEADHAAAVPEPWRQNSDQCLNYMRLCPFWDLCSVSTKMAERIAPVLYDIKPPEEWQGGVEVEV